MCGASGACGVLIGSTSCIKSRSDGPHFLAHPHAQGQHQHACLEAGPLRYNPPSWAENHKANQHACLEEKAPQAQPCCCLPARGQGTKGRHACLQERAPHAQPCCCLPAYGQGTKRGTCLPARKSPTGTAPAAACLHVGREPKGDMLACKQRPHRHSPCCCLPASGQGTKGQHVCLQAETPQAQCPLQPVHARGRGPMHGRSTQARNPLVPIHWRAGRAASARWQLRHFWGRKPFTGHRGCACYRL